MLRHLLSALLLVGLLAGCRSGSFVGSRFDNFTAYYNKFYNAQQTFEEGVEALEQDQPIDRTQYLPVFSTSVGSGSQQQFEDAIKKSADVLRGHPDSKWVDDALLLIGKSYFYQHNYVGAEQKFREVMMLESPLEDEARFWLGRALIAGSDYDAAATHLRESLEQEDLGARWVSLLRLALGELYVQQEQWEAAAAALQEGLEEVRDRELAAQAQFLLGQVLETMGRYEEAREAYEAVLSRKPRYELAFAAQVSAARVEGLYGETDAALQELRRMERDDKHYGYRAELALLRARMLQAQGHAGEALRLYEELLYDSDAGVAAIRGQIHYRLGQLYRDVFEDYRFAAAYFDTAASVLRPPRRTSAGGREITTPEAITDAAEQAEVFGVFARTVGEISRMDSLLHLGSLDEAAFREAVLRLRQQRAAEQAEQQRTLDRRQAERRFQGQGGTVPQQAPTPAAAPEGQSAGFLFHKDPIRAEEGRMSFIGRWGERPLVPNWRRLEAVDALTATEAGDGGAVPPELTAAPRAAEADALPQIDLSGVPRDSASRAAMRADRARARYELANVLFLSIGRPDSAAVWYRMVIDEDAGQAVAQRALYALAEVHRSLGDTAAAQRLYRTVLEQYPDSDFAARVQERLEQRPAATTALDSLSLAEAAYAQAYRRWKDGRYTDALSGMLSVAAAFPQTPVAPRALLAAGSIYTEWAVQDSLDLFGAWPLVLPDTLLRTGGLVAVGAAEGGASSADTLLGRAQAVDTATTSIEAAAAPAGLGLETLYAGIADRYPATPYAERARLLLEALAERRPEPEAAPDSSTDSSTAAPDSAAAAQAEPPEPPDAEPVPAPAGGESGAQTERVMPPEEGSPGAPAADAFEEERLLLQKRLQEARAGEPGSGSTPAEEQPASPDSTRTPAEPEPAEPEPAGSKEQERPY